MKLLKYTLASFFSILGMVGYSQIPRDVPNPQDNYPVDFTDPANIIILVILPLLVVVFVIIWRNKKRKDKTQQ